MENKLSSNFHNIISKFQRKALVTSIRDGLVSMIPVLIIGAFALILKTFPIKGYQTFITNFANGFLLQLFDFVYSATFGVLSIYMTFSISRSYMKIKADPNVVHGGAIIASIMCFFILAGAFLPEFGIDKMGPKSMLPAIISGLGASSLYLMFYRFFMKKKLMSFAAGSDRNFNRMLTTLLPILLVVSCFALTNLLIIVIFRTDSFHDFYIEILNKLFSVGKNGFFKGFFFVLLSSILWFFGVHGSDALEGVMQNYFVPGLAQNQADILNGLDPSCVLTKQFFDCFVLMGGCGATICLLIAILVFSQNRARKGLGLTATIPMVFNINELMVFGLPIIFNPIMLIPFLATPLVCYSISYLAISTGIVPMIVNEIEWTTPVLLGGYLATDSIMGAMLQLFNICVGVLIYLPFVKALDRESERTNKQMYLDFIDYYKANEQKLQNETLTEMNNVYGNFAKDLCAELKHDLVDNIKMYYQPQYDYGGKCIGAEALLRWRHPDHGILFPPLVVKLASECGLLLKLEEEVIKTALSERDDLINKYGEDIVLSINVTGNTIVSSEFLQFIRGIDKVTPFKGKNICFEVTEQDTLIFNDKTYEIFKEIRDMDIELAIDDFSMGQTSLQYLKHNLFTSLKIDGSLVTGLMTSLNCREIISSITELTESLNIDVIAEFVEKEEQREILHSIGCDNYQGYLYSPAKPIIEDED